MNTLDILSYKNKARLKHCFLWCLVFFLFAPCLSAQNDSAATAVPSSLEVLQSRNRRHVQNRNVVDVSDRKVERVHTTDSALQRQHNPKIAIALSAVIPGAGQIYNRKWWKVPIVYAGLGASGYFIYFYAKETKSYKTEFHARLNGRTDLLKPEYEKYSDENVLAMKNSYRRSMEIAIAAGVIIYLLNIIDAAVDAHLFYFDISDDLSLQVAPYIQQNRFTHSADRGVGLTMRF